MAVNIKKDFGNTKNRKPDITNLVYGKVPPQAAELEEAVLGAMMLEKAKQDEVMEIIQTDAVFYVDAHQKIFKAMQTLYAEGKDIDLLIVTDQLRKTDELEMIGGAYYLTRLTQSVVSSGHVESHARIIMEKFIQREIIRIAGMLIHDGYEDSTDAFDLLDKAENDLYELTSAGIKKNYEHISKGLHEVLHIIDDLKTKNVELTGVNTGYKHLNDLTGGWQPTDLIVVAARPSVGKTAFTINVALNCAMDPVGGGAVGMFNLEMDKKQVIKRMLSNLTNVLMDHISKPSKLTQEEVENLVNSFKRIASLPIYIDDTAALKMNELRAKARTMKRKHNIKLLIIDYLQLIEAGDYSNNREQQIASISRGLKKLAKDLNIPIIALSQMVRSADKENRAPLLTDLRESGAIEQDADMVMFLYRPTEKQLQNRPHLKGWILGTVQKQRNGALGDVEFHVDNRYQQWKSEAPVNFIKLASPTSPAPPAPPSPPGTDASYPQANEDDLPF